jgi:hypothetical protein
MLAKRFRYLVIALGAVIFVPKDVFACSCSGSSFAKRSTIRQRFHGRSY